MYLIQYTGDSSTGAEQFGGDNGNLILCHWWNSCVLLFPLLLEGGHVTVTWSKTSGIRGITQAWIIPLIPNVLLQVTVGFASGDCGWLWVTVGNLSSCGFTVSCHRNNSAGIRWNLRWMITTKIVPHELKFQGTQKTKFFRHKVIQTISAQERISAWEVYDTK